MTEKVIAVCSECEQVYCARSVDERVVLSTDDGHCRCGSGEFVGVPDGDALQVGA